VKGAYEGVQMQEPISWNSLQRSAEWLTALTESQWDAKRLLDYLLTSDSVIKKDGSFEISLLTIIKVRLPREAEFATIERNAAPSKRETDTHKSIATLYGSPPGDSSAYTDGPYSVHLCCLYSRHLQDLLLDQSLKIASLKENQIYYGDGEFHTGTDLCWALPYPTQHVITIDECFIEHDDLLSLGEQLCRPIVSKANAAGGAQAGDEAKQAPPIEQWKLRVQQHAAELWQRILDSGANPTVANTKDAIASWCVANDVRTDSANVHPTAEYLRTHVLSSLHWKKRPTKPTKKPEQPEQTEQA
jgi:hypothetical protein